MKPEDIEVGKEVVEICSEEVGTIQWINNMTMVQIARVAGAPKTKAAGVLLNMKLGDKVVQGDVIYRIYSGSTQKLESAFRLAKNLDAIGVTGKFGEKMLVDRIPPKRVSYEKPFILER